MKRSRRNKRNPFDENPNQPLRHTVLNRRVKGHEKNVGATREKVLDTKPSKKFSLSLCNSFAYSMRGEKPNWVSNMSPMKKDQPCLWTKDLVNRTSEWTEVTKLVLKKQTF